MGPFVLAWLVGEGIIIYRSVKLHKAPPGPGQLLLSSGVFVLLALISEVGDGGKRLATLLGWGFDIAAWMNIAEIAPKTGKTAVGWPPSQAPDTVIVPDGK